LSLERPQIGATSPSARVSGKDRKPPWRIFIADLRAKVAPKWPPLSPEDAGRRIAAERAYVDERGAVGIRLEPAAAIVRRYGGQFRRAPRRKPATRLPKPPRLLRSVVSRCRGAAAEP
jgi:hypothetical protein